MTTVPTRSWRATTGTRWKKCSSTSRAAGWRRGHRRERDHSPSRHFLAPYPGDGAALLVSADVILAAAAGAVLLRFQFLRDRAAADRVLLQSDLHELVGRNFRIRPGAAQRAGRREHRLDLDVRPDAARLHLLSSRGVTCLAAIYRLDAAADLCVRGHARASDRSRLQGRPDGLVAGHQRGAARCLLCDLPCPFAQRQTPRIFARGWRISHSFPWICGVFRPLYIWIEAFGALTHYYAFCTMLRRKQRSEIKCR